METLGGDETLTLGVGTPVVSSDSKVKKKKVVRVVKKIIKKKVIKKVPKRSLSVSNNSDNNNSVALGVNNCDINNTNSNDNVALVGNKCSTSNNENVALVENNDMCDRERVNVSERECGGSCDVDDVRKVENVNEFTVSDKEASVGLVGNSDSYMDESQLNDMVTSFLSSDQNVEIMDSDDKRVELMDSDKNIVEMRDIDKSRVELYDNGQKGIELHDGDQNLVELQDSDKNRVEMDGRIKTRVELKDGDQSGIVLPDSDKNGVEMNDSDQNVESQDKEHDNKTMESGDVGNEVAVTSESEDLKSEEVVSDRKVLTGEMVASWWNMKQRTKIFVHGLGKETKEDDIRKVFEKVGEVVELKLITNLQTGKCRGFGFVRYASADLAELALTKYRNVEIDGSTWHAAAVEGDDTILLNNIDKKWNNENLLAMLQKAGINKIDEVSVVPDPENTELNRGFAFLEFETKRDSQMAYRKLQNRNVFGEHSNIKALWAESLADPVEEEMHNVKSVYAEHIPPHWEEKEVKDHFKRFGEIESIALAKNLRTAKRNDFAFINYKTCEAALSCIEALTCKTSTNSNGPKAHPKVSLAKSIPKGKSFKTISEPAFAEVSRVNHVANQSRPFHSHQNPIQLRPTQAFLGVFKPQQVIRRDVSSIGRHEDGIKNDASSTTSELVKLLREQASWKLGGPSSTAGMSIDHHQPRPVGKQLPTELVRNSLYHDPRAYHQTHPQIPNPTHPRPIVTSVPHYNQQRGHYTNGSLNMVQPNPRYNPGYFQTRSQATYPGSSSNIYRPTR